MSAPGRSSAGASLTLTLVLASLLGLGTAGLVALGALALREWRRSSVLAAERQAEVTLALLTTALNRDMKGTQVALLLPLRAEDVAADPPHDLRHTPAGRGFARFSYPEWFFSVHGGGTRRERTWLFTRAERPPPWAQPGPAPAHSVAMTADPPMLRDLVGEVRRRVVPGRRFVVFDWDVGDRRYQIVAESLREGAGGARDLAGFAVDLQWIREHYFAELLDEIAHIGGRPDVSLSITDTTGAVVAQTAPRAEGVAARERAFPLLFFDGAMTSLLPPGHPPAARWTARAAVSDDAVDAARRGAHRILGLLSLAAAASVVGLVLTARAVRARAALAALKSEFVATVTHELKAPLAVVRLAADTLAQGRCDSPAAVSEYGRLVSQESRRLARLVDNLLIYSRVSDVQGNYRFEALEVAELVDDAVTRVGARLVELGFETDVDVPIDLPRIRGDRVALLQTLDNVIDNAIRYSTARRILRIQGRADGNAVHLAVSDRGHGIPEADLPYVFDRFHRARNAVPGGTGLGLAIVRRIVDDHRGQVHVTSRVDDGTTITLVLPAERS